MTASQFVQETASQSWIHIFNLKRGRHASEFENQKKKLRNKFLHIIFNDCSLVKMPFLVSVVYGIFLRLMVVFCLLFCGVCTHVNVLLQLQKHPNLNLISALSTIVTKIQHQLKKSEKNNTIRRRKPEQLFKERVKIGYHDIYSVSFAFLK